MFITQRRVEFRDTDAAGIVHFSAFFPMMEAAEHAMLRSLGISVMASPAGGEHAKSQPSNDSPGHVTWPRVSAHCDYRAAARFEDILDVAVSVLHLGNSCVEYGIRFTRAEPGDATDSASKPTPTVIADGKLTAVCCTLSPGGKLKKTPIPEDLRKLLAKHLNSQTFSADHA